MFEEHAPDQCPPGFILRHTLRGHNGVIFRIAWSPDGTVIASGSNDRTVRLWDVKTGKVLHTLEGHYAAVLSVTWSPDGRMIASGSNDRTVRLWDVETGRLLRTIEGHSDPVKSVAWSPDGRTIASGSSDRTVRLCDAATGRLRHLLEGHSEHVKSVAWSPDGRTIASAGGDRTIRLCDASTGRLRRTLEGHFRRGIKSVTWSPNGCTIASGGDDGTIRMWDGESGKLLAILPGHANYVRSVSFSSSGSLLASKAGDGTVRLWRCDTSKTIAILDESASGFWPPSLAFHPSEPVLATLGEKDRIIRIWNLELDVPSGARAHSLVVSYTNAKVALLGDTGVGKTGLGIRLAEGTWRPTDSTHGMNVRTLYSKHGREVMLWDFAGQDEYRLVHQLFLNETNVALILYDPTKSNDSFFGVDYWEKALKNAGAGEVVKILVAARSDVGYTRMAKADIEAYCKAHGYLAHIAASAKTGEGCDALRDAIMNAIPWEQLPRTSSPNVFKRVKDFLAEVRQGKRVLVSEDSLMAEFNARAGGEKATEAEFRTVIGHVETAGLIKRLSFGDLVLLKPELLNGYASDIIDAARRHLDGLGAVPESVVLEGHVPIREEGGLIQADRIFLLHATVELFLRLGLALEQNGNLVFPSKFNRIMPALAKDPVVEVEFSFEGPVENLYTTLIVKLYYGGVFRLKKLWKNAAEFLNGRAQVCGFQLLNRGGGQGRLKVFYAEGVRDDDKALFLKIISDHFAEKGIEKFRRERLYRCPECREPVRDRNAVRRALERGAAEMPCLYCFKPFPLVDALEVLYHDDEKFLSQIAAMESKAEASMERGGDLVAASAEMKTESFKQWAGGAGVAKVAIVFTDVLGSTSLNVEMGDEPWRGVREAHFARARKLIDEGHGYFIKSIGDSVMAAFHSASDALDFALAFRRDTGHKAIRIRAGIHVGPVEVASADAFGQHVNLASRIEGKAKEGGIWTSDKVKEDVDTLRAARHSKLRWTEHRDEELRGFPDRLFVLWSVEE